MLRKSLVVVALASALTIASLPVATAPARAASNILEEGLTDQDLIGYAVYKWNASGQNDRVVVRASDRSRGAFYVTWANGYSSWISGSELYTETQAKLADQQWNTGWGLFGLAVAGAVMSGSGNSPSNSTNSGENSPTYYPPPSNSNSGSDDQQDNSTEQSSGLHGNCHGGAYYGCPN